MSDIKFTHTAGQKALIIDGVDVSRQVLADGFSINISEFADERSTVTVTFIADRLDVDLEDAQVVEQPRRLCEGGVQA